MNKTVCPSLILFGKGMGRTVLVFVFCLISKLNGIGRTMMKATETAGTSLTFPYNIRRGCIHGNIMNGTITHTKAATDTSVRNDMKETVRNKFSIKEAAKWTGLKGRKYATNHIRL